MTDNLPAPMVMIELSVCGCKSECSTNRCKCRKNGLPCMDTCKCKGCENTGDDNDADGNDLKVEPDSDEDFE